VAAHVLDDLGLALFGQRLERGIGAWFACAHSLVTPKEDF